MPGNTEVACPDGETSVPTSSIYLLFLAPSAWQLLPVSVALSGLTGRCGPKCYLGTVLAARIEWTVESRSNVFLSIVKIGYKKVSGEIHNTIYHSVHTMNRVTQRLSNFVSCPGRRFLLVRWPRRRPWASPAPSPERCWGMRG